MLKFNVHISDSVERPVAQGYLISAEGQALVADYSDGVFGVKPSEGAEGEQFVGVAMSQQLTVEYMPKVEDLSVPATGTYVVHLENTPVSGSLAVISPVAGVLTSGTPATGEDKYSISGTTITVNSARASESLRVSYRYSPTVVEAKAIQGDIPPGGSAGILLGTVGVIRRGDVYTSEYDTTVDWSDPVAVYLADNGLFTTDSNSDTATKVNATVISIPSASNPFLGLELRG